MNKGVVFRRAKEDKTQRHKDTEFLIFPIKKLCVSVFYLKSVFIRSIRFIRV